MGLITHLTKIGAKVRLLFYNGKEKEEKDGFGLYNWGKTKKCFRKIWLFAEELLPSRQKKSLRGRVGVTGKLIKFN